MSGHTLINVEPAGQRPARSSKFVRHFLVGAAALTMCDSVCCVHTPSLAFVGACDAVGAHTDSLAFAPAGLGSLFRTVRCAPAPNRCRLGSGPQLGLSMGAPNVKGGWSSAIRSKVKNALKKMRGDALDDSWQAQAMVYNEERQAAKDKSKVMEDAGMCATQMLWIQTLRTRKYLYEYQLQDATPDTSFGSIYSDICDDDHASLPFVSQLPDAVDDTPRRRSGSAGIRYLQEHLLGVPVPDLRPMPSQAVASAAERLTDNILGEKQDAQFGEGVEAAKI